MDFEEAMDIALEEAKLALSEGEVPVGAVVLKDGKVISRAHNRRQNEYSVIGHAEILAILEAEKVLGKWQLDGCQLIVTLEPCIMCAGAIAQTRIATLIYGASDQTFGAFSTGCDPFTTGIYPSPLIYRGSKENECKSLLDRFFKGLRI